LTSLATTSFLTITPLGEAPISTTIHPKRQSCVCVCVCVCATRHTYLLTHPYCITLLFNQLLRGSIHALIHPSGPTLIHDSVYLPIYLYYQFTFLRINQTTCLSISLRYDAYRMVYICLLFIYLFFCVNLNSLTFEVSQSKELFLDCLINALPPGEPLPPGDSPIAVK
jgi:hypothetical protein